MISKLSSRCKCNSVLILHVHGIVNIGIKAIIQFLFWSRTRTKDLHLSATVTACVAHNRLIILVSCFFFAASHSSLRHSFWRRSRCQLYMSLAPSSSSAAAKTSSKYILLPHIQEWLTATSVGEIVAKSGTEI